MITRIMKLPKHNNVLIGRDLAELFEPGHVYEIKKLIGEYVIIDLGESSINNTKGAWGEISMIMTSPYYLLTEEELDND